MRAVFLVEACERRVNGLAGRKRAGESALSASAHPNLDLLYGGNRGGAGRDELAREVHAGVLAGSEVCCAAAKG
ncbi:MAG: hypothetical protein P4L84_09565 [Isosphaeraceae bacterium]|nr:hypothetical protein [Isosphaeraceae bacterium]